MGDGQFAEPQGIATDPSGNVYVAEDGNDDVGNARIQKFTSTGAFLTKWGSPGTAEGQFEEAEGIATDSSGNVYVAEYQNNRVQKFTSTGAFVSAWGFGVTDAGAFYQVCTASCHEGLPGAPVLGSPTGIATDTADNVYVATSGYATGDQIQKFTSAGAQVTSWGSTGSGDGQFQFLGGLATDTANNVYVGDSGRIQKFTSGGSFLTKWDADLSGSPQGIATDPANNVYVVAGTGIQKFTSTGALLANFDLLSGSCALGALGIATDTAGDVFATESDTNDNPFIAKFGETSAPPPSCPGDNPPQSGGIGNATPTGQRAAALKKCKKRKGKARKKCKQKANKLPV